MPSVVIPAHNEAAVIGRLLQSLSSGPLADELDIVVVANGCTDETVAIAEGFGPRVRVVSTPEPSKFRALRLGDQHAHGFPRLYVDADVSIGAADLIALATVLDKGEVLAVAPARVLGVEGASRLVRWYYDVWQQLPTVVNGLYGRGVIGVSAEGHARLTATPEVMADDLAASVAFGPDEAAVVSDATVVVQAPRTARDLIRRRVRAATSIAQLHQHTPDAVDSSRTTKADLIGIAKARPSNVGKLVAFLGVTVVARRRARAAIKSGDFTTWLRDESSRTGGPSTSESENAPQMSDIATKSSRQRSTGAERVGGER